MTPKRRRGKNIIQGTSDYVKSHVKARGMEKEFRKTISSMPAEKRIQVKVTPTKESKELIDKIISRGKISRGNPKIRDILVGIHPIRAGGTPERHAKYARIFIKGIADALDIGSIKVEGRVKNVSSLRRKLISNETFSKILHSKNKNEKQVLEKFLSNEWIGLRITVRTEEDLHRLANTLKLLKVSYTEPESGRSKIVGVSRVKDYVSEPRQDGLIHGGNPKDVYRAMHIQTYGLTGAPMEIQILTEEMKKNIEHLDETYGKNHWKTPEFRARKRALGDYR